MNRIFGRQIRLFFLMDIIFFLAATPKKIPEPDIQTPRVIIPKEDPFSHEDKTFEYEDHSEKEYTEQNAPSEAPSKTGLSLRLKDDN